MVKSDGKRAANKKKYGKATKQVNFKSWSKSRREKRDAKGKKPWTGVFRDPVKFSKLFVFFCFHFLFWILSQTKLHSFDFACCIVCAKS